MGGGAGSGMNWWWDSWIHQGDAYDVFSGAAAYAKLMDLSGQNYQTLRNMPGVSVSTANVGAIGYLVEDRLYAYLYDQTYTYQNPETALKTSVTLTIPMLHSGNYSISFFNTVTGALIATSPILQTVDGQLTIALPAFSNDIALILKPNQE